MCGIATGDSFANALELSHGFRTDNTDSAMLTAGENHYYQIRLSAGSYTLATSGTTDIHCQLYDRPQTQLVIDDNSGTGTSCSITRDLTAGTYYIQIRGAANDTAGAYTLTITR